MPAEHILDVGGMEAADSYEFHISECGDGADLVFPPSPENPHGLHVRRVDGQWVQVLDQEQES